MQDRLYFVLYTYTTITYLLYKHSLTNIHFCVFLCVDVKRRNLGSVERVFQIWRKEKRQT